MSATNKNLKELKNEAKFIIKQYKELIKVIKDDTPETFKLTIEGIMINHLANILGKYYEVDTSKINVEMK